MLLTEYLHLNVPVSPRGGVNVTRLSGVRLATPPLGHTGSVVSCGRPPPDRSESLTSTSIVTGLSVSVSAKSSRADGAFGSASSSTVTVTLPVASLPWPSLILYVNVTGVGSLMSGRFGVNRTESPSTTEVPEPSRGSAADNKTSTSLSGSMSLAVTGIFTELPITTRSASGLATGGRFGAVSLILSTRTFPVAG